MRDINQVVVTGRLTRDAELKYTRGGTAVAEYAVAVNRSVKKGDQWEDEASFFDCTMFGRFAEVMSEHLTKGAAVTLAGELRQDRWQNQEGQNRSKVGIIVNQLTLGAKPNSEQRPAQRPSRPEPAATDDDFPDDIPF